MKVTVQVVIEADDDASGVRDVFTLQRGTLAPDTLGLRLDEAKDILCAVQETVVEAQVTAALVAQAPCPHCQTPRRHKDARDIVVRSLSERCACPAPAGGTAPAGPSTPGPSARWLRWLQSGPPRSCPTCKPASPAWLPTGPPPRCWPRCCPSVGVCTPPRFDDRPTPWPSAWRTNSATSGGASSTAANETGKRCPVPTCRSPSASTAATSTPASSDHAGTGGSR